MINRFKFRISIIIFFTGLIFLSSILIIHIQRPRFIPDETNIKKGLVWEARLKAIEDAQKEKKTKYHFMVSARVPFFPSFSDIGEKQ